MLELHQILLGLSPVLGSNVHILEEIVKGIYRISSGGVTMLNISRWTDKGGSYRNVQRFFSQSTDWLALNILLLKYLITGSSATSPDAKYRYCLALDEVVEDKAGKETYGVSWFFSSIIGKVIRSVSNHVISLIDTKKEKSYVLTHEQTVKPDKARKKNNARKGKSSKSKSKAKKGKPINSKNKGKAGRPKGSKNKQLVKKEGLLYDSFTLLLSLVVPLVRLLCPMLTYVLADGAYGNKTCCLIVREFGLELVSKLNRNTALYLPYQGEYSGKGRPRKYGEKIDYSNLPKESLVSSIEDKEEGIVTQVYQIKEVWTRRMPYLINVVIIIKTDVATQKSGRVVLFSTDLEIQAEQLIKLYRQRFQIEFNFRDAKQYFGLADFKNIKEQQVKNAVGLSFFMDNLSAVLIEQAEQKWQEENLSIQDLKAYFRAGKYLVEILNTLKIPVEGILNRPEVQPILKIGAINRTISAKSTS